MRLPGANEYIDALRRNKYIGAKLKKQTEEDIGWFVKILPKFERPIEIHFIWIEQNGRRDLDNIAFAKKFILDAMVKTGRIPNDNRTYIKGFRDSFIIGNEYKVILQIFEKEWM